jgi:hypothetical protein
LDQVPEKISHYPEFSMFGELPAWGFYIRHVDGLTMKNVHLSIQEPDYRPAMIFDDVSRLNLQSLSIERDDKEKHIILSRTEKVNIDKEECRFKNAIAAMRRILFYFTTISLF